MRDLLFNVRTKKPIGYRFSSIVLGMCLVFPAVAVSNEAPQTLTLADAVTLTLQQHPELQIFNSQQRVMEGRIQQASVGERPEIGLMIEDALGTGEHSALKSMQSTLSFSWLLQQDLIDSRVNTAKTEATQLDI